MIARFAPPAVGVAAATTAVLSFSPLFSVSPVVGLINVLVVATFALTGTILCDDPAQRPTGIDLIGAAFFYLASWWWAWPPEWQWGPVPLVSYVCGYLWFVLGVRALLRFPDAGLQRWWDRGYVALLAAWVLVPKLGLATTTVPERVGAAGRTFPETAWWPTVVDSPSAFETGTQIADVGLVVVAAAVVVPLGLKIWRSRGLDRADAVPGMTAAATVMICGCAYLLAKVGDFSPQAVEVLRAVIGVAALFTPVAFLTTALRYRLARDSLARLVADLAGTPDTLEELLRQGLSDPGLTVWTWQPERQTFTSSDGAETRHLPVDERYEVHVNGRDGALLAVLLVDPALRRREGLLSVLIGLSGLVQENVHMYNETRRQLRELQEFSAELRESAARNARAEENGRRQTRRDLHDGAQQTLMLVLASLGEARRATTSDSPASVAVDRAIDNVKQAVRELRLLARGIASPVLMERGLRAAILDRSRHLDLAIETDVVDERFDPSIEGTAYFIVAEALTNAVKYAGAESVTVSVSRDGIDPDLLRINVRDDGKGGAVPGPDSGLSGLRDRVITVGGRMTIDSPPGEGTELEVYLPCE